MITNAYISEYIKTEIAVAPRDLNAANFTGTFFPVQNARRIMGTLVSSTIAAGKKITIQLMKARDAAGTGAVALTPPVDVVAGAGGQILMAQVEAVVEDFGEGFTHVAVRVDSDNGIAVQGAAMIQFGNLRYNP